MPIPIVYRRGRDFVASYDWIDFARRVGYVRFNAAQSSLTAGTSSFITTQDDITSFPASTIMNCDVDFDVTFNAPVIVAASDAIANIAASIFSDGHTINCTVNVYHVDGGGETSIGQGVLAQEAAQGAAGVTTYRYRCVKIPMTRKKFKIGDKLRFNVIMTTAGGGGNGYLMHDPANIGGVTYGKLTSIDIPFKVEM